MVAGSFPVARAGELPPLDLGNTPNALICKPCNDSGINQGADAVPQAVEADTETSDLSASESSTTNEVEYTSTEAADSFNNHGISGIDVVPATESQSAEHLQISIPVSSASSVDSTPESPAESASDVPQEWPASTGSLRGIFRKEPGFFKENNDSFPVLCKSQSSSPRKMRLPSLRFKGWGSSPRHEQANVSSYGEEGLLNSRDQCGRAFGGYDMSHVLEGTVLHVVSPNDPPRSTREILRAGSGEVLAVRAAAFEDNADTKNDTVML